MPATGIATGSKTIIDLSDGKTLTAYLETTSPKTQIYDPNTTSFQPDWSTNNVTITPYVYANGTAISMSSSSITDFKWYENGVDITSNPPTGITIYDGTQAGTTKYGILISANLLTNISQVTFRAAIQFTDPDTTFVHNISADILFTKVVNGTNGSSAKIVEITGEQVFKYAQDTGTPTPTSITLTASGQNLSSQSFTWQFKKIGVAGATWTSVDSSKITDQTTKCIVEYNNTSFFGSDLSVKSVAFKASAEGSYDEFTIYKVYDGTGGTPGQPGQSASTVFLTNENITFPADSSGQIAATTVISNVVAYTGTSKVAPTVGTPTNVPTQYGMQITVGQKDANDEIPLTITIANNSTLGGTSGTISVPVSIVDSNTSATIFSTSLSLSWSRVDGGSDSVVMSLYAPNGNVFVNGSGDKSISVSGYCGTADIANTTSSSFTWYEYSSGWQEIQNEHGASLTVHGSDVNGQRSFKCRMEYPKNSGNYYFDTITFTDQTDNYQATIDSTGGDSFKNGVGESYLICRLWQNGAEVDEEKQTSANYRYTHTTPDNSKGSNGDYLYYCPVTPGTQSAPKATVLYKKTNGSWAIVSDSSDQHEHTYTWTRINKDGTELDTSFAFATGKVIYVDGNDVEVKCVFFCEVS